MLRNQRLGIDPSRVKIVTKFLRESVVDYLVGTAAIVFMEVFDVLKHKSRWSMDANDVCQVIKEVALLFVFEPMLSSQTILLGNTRQAERLTRKTRAEYVELWNRRDVYRSDIAERALAEICLVCLLRKLIPITRENAFSPGFLKGQSKSANAAEQIDKPELFVKRFLQMCTR